MTQILLRAHLGKLVPVDDQALTYIRKLKDTETVRADVRRVRNPKQHRLWWALVTLIHGQQDEWPTIESLSKAILCAAGHGKVIKSKSGIQTLEAKSIAFGNLDQDQFDAILEKSIRVICERILPGVKSDDLRAEVLEMIS